MQLIVQTTEDGRMVNIYTYAVLPFSNLKSERKGANA